MPGREDLLQPIPGPNPGGANLRYDPLWRVFRRVFGHRNGDGAEH